MVVFRVSVVVGFRVRVKGLKFRVRAVVSVRVGVWVVVRVSNRVVFRLRCVFSVSNRVVFRVRLVFRVRIVFRVRVLSVFTLRVVFRVSVTQMTLLNFLQSYCLVVCWFDREAFHQVRPD